MKLGELFEIMQTYLSVLFMAKKGFWWKKIEFIFEKKSTFKSEGYSTQF